MGASGCAISPASSAWNSLESLRIVTASKRSVRYTHAPESSSSRSTMKSDRSNFETEQSIGNSTGSSPRSSSAAWLAFSTTQSTWKIGVWLTLRSGRSVSTSRSNGRS